MKPWHLIEEPPMDEIYFTEHLIHDGYNYSFGLSTVDLTGTGSLDLVSVDTEVGLYWFENDGDGNFTHHVIHERQDEWLERHTIADINGDGKPEIVCVDNINGGLLWFEFDGDPRDRSAWRHHHITVDELPGSYDVVVADLTGNGRLDVAASSWRKGNQFAWFENQGQEWIKHTIEDDIAETRTVCAVDFDGNGRMDLLGTAFLDDQIAWYENPGDPANDPWKKHIIDTPGQPIHGHPADMDGDGGIDVVMALGMRLVKDRDPVDHQIVWYEHGGDPRESWTKHIVCDHFPDAFEAIAADIDNDGRTEIVASAWGDDGRIALFKHNGDPRGTWSMQILKAHWPKANQVILADLTGNGRLDIIAGAERGSNEVRWWRNEGPA